MEVSRCLARSDTGACALVEDPVNIVISDAMLNVSLGQDSASGDFVQVIIIDNSKRIFSAPKCVIISLCPEQLNMQCAYFDESLRTMRHHNYYEMSRGYSYCQ